MGCAVLQHSLEKFLGPGAMPAEPRSSSPCQVVREGNSEAEINILAGRSGQNNLSIVCYSLNW